MNEYESQQYDSDEVTCIIRRALKIKNEDRISHLAFHYKAVYYTGRKRFDRRPKRRHGRAGFVMCEK